MMAHSVPAEGGRWGDSLMSAQAPQWDSNCSFFVVSGSQLFCLVSFAIQKKFAWDRRSAPMNSLSEPESGQTRTFSRCWVFSHEKSSAMTMALQLQESWACPGPNKFLHPFLSTSSNFLSEEQTPIPSHRKKTSYHPHSSTLLCPLFLPHPTYRKFSTHKPRPITGALTSTFTHLSPNWEPSAHPFVPTDQCSYPHSHTCRHAPTQAYTHANANTHLPIFHSPTCSATHTHSFHAATHPPTFPASRMSSPLCLPSGSFHLSLRLYVPRQELSQLFSIR